MRLRQAGKSPASSTSLLFPNVSATSQSGVRSVDVIALVRAILVIGQALLLGDAATANDARLQIGDHRVDLRGCQRDTGGIQIIRRGSQRSPIAGADLVGPLIERGHSGAAWLPAADYGLELRRVEPGGPQIRAGGRLIALLLSIREGTMAVRATALLPDLQPGFRLVTILRDACGHACENANGGGHNGAQY